MNVRVVAPSAWGSGSVVPAYWPNGSTKHPAFLEALGGGLEGAPTMDAIVLLGDSTAHMGMVVLPGGV